MCELPSLFLIFNHTFTEHQEENARQFLGVTRIISLPDHLQQLWSAIPPELSEIDQYLDPIRKWLGSEASKHDFVLIQGDFGATFILVNTAFELELVPIYSTTRRVVTEEILNDGSIKMTHHFQHSIFRKYGC
ncbi:MAG: hypothetical protein HQK77_12305 [Desulfobacterales bacterium]|nr:hypothetical protein [Desulfobacterales bacterium]